MIKNNLFIGVVPMLLMVAPVCAQLSGTEVTKWQDGKDACVSITYDDSSINQFRVAIPLMNERGLPGTFFIITGTRSIEQMGHFPGSFECTDGCIVQV